jgi:hypothetical protein
VPSISLNEEIAELEEKFYILILSYFSYEVLREVTDEETVVRL